MKFKSLSYTKLEMVGHGHLKIGLVDPKLLKHGFDIENS